MTYDSLLVDKQAGITRITLNRPAMMNAVNAAMHQELRLAMDAVEADNGLRVLVLSGSGKAFCTGQDLKERKQTLTQGTPDLGASLNDNYNPLIRRLRKLPVPVVAVVNGVAAGAGSSLALAADIVIAARSARFIQSFSKVGLIPDSGSTWILPRHLGTARAMGLAMLGESISAERALESGLIWACVDDQELAEQAESLIKRLAAMPTYGLGLIKQAIYASGSNTLEAQLNLEADSQRLAGSSEDYREGVMAFLEKRNPKFIGK